MRRASESFTDEQRRTVQQAVIEAERRTSAEIVPAVATASGRYDRAEDIVGLWLGILGMIVAWWLLPAAAAESGSWGGMPEWGRLVALMVAVLAGFVIGAVLASHVGWLRHLFTPQRQMRDEVTMRAHAVFFDRRVHHTTGGTGLLIYVSLYERMAAVVADQSVLDKLGQDVLDELCAALTASLGGLPPAEALSQTIRAAGEKLSAVLPRAEDDVNELPDTLVLLDR